MSALPDDGGPAWPGIIGAHGYGEAFPSKFNDETIWINVAPGMSLRDWFAGQALAGMCANTDIAFENHLMPEHPADCAGSMSQNAYLIADAMIAARKNPPTP